jgi:superfamily II DNA or RNA helicase
MLTLYPFQQEHANAIINTLREYRVTLDHSRTGTGKTFVAAHAALTLGLRPVVFCPKSVIPSWRSVFEIAGLQGEVTNYELATRGKGIDPSVAGIERTGSTIGIFPADEDRTLLVFDEVHRCKGEDTLNTQLLLGATRTRCKLLLLSATAVESPMDMRGIGVAFGLFRDRDYFRWKMAHGVRKLWHGHFGLDPRQLPHAIAKIKHAIGPRMHGMDVDALSNFPETFIGTHLVPLPEKLERDSAEEIESLLEQSEQAEAAIVKLLRLRQAIEIAKAEVMAERAAEHHHEGRSVATFLTFHDAIATYCTRLRKLLPGVRVERFDGATSGVDRELLLADFQADRLRHLCLQISSGGTGISLHDLNGVYPRVSLISPDFSARNLIQVLGRVHRAGGRSKSVQEIILADYPIDRGVKLALDRKIGAIETLTDTDIYSSLPFINETKEQS